METSEHSAGSDEETAAGTDSEAAERDRPIDGAEGSTGADGAEASDEDDVRKKFREALNSKRSNQGDAKARGGGKKGSEIHGTDGPALGRRTFRRKSG